MSLWRPNRYRASDTVAVCGEGGRRRVAAWLYRKCLGLGQCVGNRAGHSVMTLDGHCVVAVTAAGEDFREPTGRETENLKKLTICTPDQLARIPGFQVFRF